MEDFNSQNFNESTHTERGFDVNSTENTYHTTSNSHKDDRGLLLPAPNANLILTLGILSIPGICCCNGIVGIVLAIIAIFLATKSKKEVRENFDMYDETTLSKVGTGKTCAIIGLIFSIICMIFALYIVSALDFNSLTGVSSGTWNQLGY